MSIWDQKVTSGTQDGDFEKAPPGNHPARLVAMIDLGTQRNDFQGEVKWQRRIYFVWELTHKPKEDAKVNHVIGLDLTLSMNEKSKLRKFIEARLGKRLPEDGSYKITEELGKPCLLSVVEKNGYPKVDGVSAVPEGLEVKPAKYHQVAIDLDMFRRGDGDVPLYVPWLYGREIKDVIASCRELSPHDEPKGGGPTGADSGYEKPLAVTADGEEIPF